MEDTTKKLCLEMIKQVATENGYDIVGGENHFEITMDRWHSVAFEIFTQQYIQVHQWEAIDDKGNGKYGRGVYSIRTIPNAVAFCQILIASESIRARRIDPA